MIEQNKETTERFFENEAYITIQEAQKIAGVSRQTLYTWMDDDKIKYKQMGYFRLLSEKDIRKIAKLREY